MPNAQMSTSEIRPAVASTSTARARVCSRGTPGCKNELSLNNRSGICGDCQAKLGRRRDRSKKRTNGHNGVQQRCRLRSNAKRRRRRSEMAQLTIPFTTTATERSGRRSPTGCFW